MERKTYVLHGKKFEAPQRYSVTKVIGFGAYGLVVAAMDAEASRKVAIKKCRNICRSVGDGKRILREVKLLKFMHHENVLGLCDFYVANEDGVLADAYIVSEHLDSDLHNVIRSRQKFTDDHVRYFVYQVLRGLKYIHSAGVMHRDLKPANLLVNINCDLKIADFGLSRASESATDDAALTDYVVTRWYRPPELLLMNHRYHCSIDAWSTGCILLELIKRQPAFPGKDYLDQLNRIVDALGSRAALADDRLSYLENSESRKFLQTQLPRVRFDTSLQAIQELVPDPRGDLHDFLDMMLQFDPSKRGSAASLSASFSGSAARPER